jgi:tryptophan halogenase
MDDRTRHIVIVGGGTAGWLTAGIIAARHRARMAGGFTVTLVESPDTPIIGVGEGTWPTLRSTLQKMAVSETDFSGNAMLLSSKAPNLPAGPRGHRMTPITTR